MNSDIIIYMYIRSRRVSSRLIGRGTPDSKYIIIIMIIIIGFAGIFGGKVGGDGGQLLYLLLSCVGNTYCVFS